MPLRAFLHGVLALSLLVLFSCKQEKQEPVYRVIGEAYAGPNELPIRQDISLRSPMIAKVQHGEKLEIIDRRRRFVQVRTQSKSIGWVDMRLLISDKQMDMLEALAKHYAKAPSMGSATVFDILNVHTDPNRYSPTFLQIQEKEKVEVVGHKVAPRVPFQGETLDIEDDNAQKKVAQKPRPKKEPKVPPPPSPPAPKVPDNWLELSQSHREEVRTKGGAPDSKTPPPVVMDDLSLIRTKDGRVGWVLTNALFLEVPDDVAQYAEGNRITSYFEMGEVLDGDTKHKQYLWTTQSQKLAPFEFDGIRLFTWSTRRHRYETSYRERNLRGYYPTVVDTSKPQPEFQIIVEDAEGKVWQRSYVFNGSRVQFLGKKPYEPAPDMPQVSAKAPTGPQEEPGLWQRFKKLIGKQ